MLCRVAEDMFWMSRYIERGLAAVRLVEVTRHLELDAGEIAEGETDLWMPLLGSSSELPGWDGAAMPTPGEVRQFLAFADENPNSALSCIRRARTAAQGVRESISSEMWEQLNTLHLSLMGDLASRAEDDPHVFYRRLHDEMLFFQGLADATLAHDEGWHFFCLGKYLERADNVARVLNLQAHLLESDGDSDDMVRRLAVLRSCGSFEAYARYYSLRVESARVVEFLLLNPVFPQSVRFSLCAARDALNHISRGGAAQANPADRALGLLSSRLEHAAVDEIFEYGLEPYLTEVQNEIAQTSEQITRWYLRQEPHGVRAGGAARAAAIMAGQQQQ
ncbi:MAG: alpha-E domain-containing protein [Dehalococcoidia bacterium]